MMLWGYVDALYIGELLQALAMVAAGGGMFASGVSIDRSLKRYVKYLAVLGDREAMPVEEIARTLGYSARRVEKDLQKMIDKGYFGGKAYLNVELGYLFRSGRADADLKKQRSAAQTPPPETETAIPAFLRNIRRPTRIADRSFPPDRPAGDIAAKFFSGGGEDPEKEPHRTF